MCDKIVHNDDPNAIDGHTRRNKEEEDEEKEDKEGKKRKNLFHELPQIPTKEEEQY